MIHPFDRKLNHVKKIMSIPARQITEMVVESCRDIRNREIKWILKNGAVIAVGYDEIEGYVMRGSVEELVVKKIRSELIRGDEKRVD